MFKLFANIFKRNPYSLDVNQSICGDAGVAKRGRLKAFEC